MRWNLKIVKSRRSKSAPKKNGGLGHLFFIYDQNSKSVFVDEPDVYVRPISGFVEFFIDEGHDDAQEGKRERGTAAGRFDASYINVDNTLVDGVKLYGVMASYSAETAEIYETLFDPPTDKLRKDVKEVLGVVTHRNILVINWVEILPAYRGMGLGLATIWTIIQRHSSGCGIVAIKAFPLQFKVKGWSGRLSDQEERDWNKKMGYDPFSYTLEYAHEKVIILLMKLGFKRIGDLGVVALSTSMQNPIPREIHRWVP